MHHETTRPETGGEKGTFSFFSLVNRVDFVLALIIIAVCGLLYYITYTFDTVPEALSQGVPPVWFPRLLLWIIAILSASIPFEHLFLAKGKSLEADRKVRVKPIAIYSTILLCVIVGLMPWLGTILTMVLVCLLLPLLWGERRVKVLIPFAIVFPGLVTLLFAGVLRLYFEPGILAVFY